MFEPVLWPEGGEHLPQRFQPGSAVPQDAREVWFTGTHGDVGGGWPEAVSGLAKIPLLWMIEETKVLGLDYITQTVNRLVKGAHEGQPYVAPDALAPVNDSMTRGVEAVRIPAAPGQGRGAETDTRPSAPRASWRADPRLGDRPRRGDGTSAREPSRRSPRRGRTA